MLASDSGIGPVRLLFLRRSISSRVSLVRTVVTTEFMILELAYSRLSSLPRACAPTGLRFTGATTYKVFGPYSTQKTSLIGGGFFCLICCAPPPSLHDVGLSPNNLPLSHTHRGAPAIYVTLEIFLSDLAFLTMGSLYQLLEPVVTTEFSILELACSWPSSLRACAPTGPKSTGADNI